MSARDPYEILGVPRTATQDQLKTAYRRLAKQFHPDRNKGEKSAEERFKEVQAAYEVLGDPARRSEYDRFGTGGPKPEYQRWTSHQSPDVGPGVYADFDNDDLMGIFEQFFTRGQRGPRRRQAAGPQRAPLQQIHQDLEISFEEAALGTTRELRIQTPDGSIERLEFKVPAGVAEGQQLRIRGKAGQNNGRMADILVRCHIRPHPVFRREGLDVLVDLPVNVYDALLGGKAPVPTLTGSALVTVPPGTSSGTKLRLRGQGIDNARTGQRGDLYAVVRIVLPRDLSPAGRELVEKLAREAPVEARGGAA